MTPNEGLRAAIEITRSMLQENADGEGWDGTVALTREYLREGDLQVTMALAHLQVLTYATELTEAIEAEGIKVEGTPGGTTPENLLEDIERQVLAHGEPE